LSKKGTEKDRSWRGGKKATEKVGKWNRREVPSKTSKKEYMNKLKRSAIDKGVRASV